MTADPDRLRVLDLMLPDMEGFEVARRLAAEKSHKLFS